MQKCHLRLTTTGYSGPSRFTSKVKCLRNRTHGHDEPSLQQYSFHCLCLCSWWQKHTVGNHSSIGQCWLQQGCLGRLGVSLQKQKNTLIKYGAIRAVTFGCLQRASLDRLGESLQKQKHTLIKYVALRDVTDSWLHRRSLSRLGLLSK